RHMVTRALGAGPDSDPGDWLIPAEAGNRMLVRSDGLSGEVDEDAIEQMLRSPADVRTVCSVLVRQALDAGGHDNVSVVVVEAVEVVGQTLASENTADNEAISADSADDEVDEDTLPRGIAEDGRGR